MVTQYDLMYQLYYQNAVIIIDRWHELELFLTLLQLVQINRSLCEPKKIN